MSHSQRKGKDKQSSRSSRQHYPARWSDWEWDDEYGRWWRAREIEPDNYVYEYEDGAQSAANTIPTSASVNYDSQSTSRSYHDEDELFEPTPLADQDSFSTIPTSGKAFESTIGTSSDPAITSLPAVIDSFSSFGISSPPSGQQTEQLDKRYVIRDQPSRWFQIGRVFKVLWTEPASGMAMDLNQESLYTVAFGQQVFSKIRRFVVIRKRLHCCLCLPITTYGGQGAAKGSARAEDHAIVYDGTRYGAPEPEAAPGEQLSKSALGVIIEERHETLDPRSRIDFGKVYTVQHNIRVMNVGRIDNLNRLKRYYNDSMRIDSE